MTSATQANGEQRVNGIAAGVFGAAMLLSALAGWSALSLRQRVPQVQINALDPDEISKAFRTAAASAPEQAREGWLLRYIGERLTDALRHASPVDEVRKEIGPYAAGLTYSQLGRLQQVALRMLELERAGVPGDQWWPALEPYLVGLTAANFAHFERELLLTWTAAYRSLGVDAGTAYRTAQGHVGHRHNPFLQYFVARLERVATAEEHAGRTNNADTCRMIVRRLLRQWVLDPGSPGLRLLAADLLANLLEGHPLSASSTQTGQLAETLRAWRSAYRDSARQRQADLLGPISEPAPCPREHRRLFGWLVFTSIVCAAAAGVGLLALATGWAWLLPSGRKVGMPSTCIAAALVTAAVITAAEILLARASQASVEGFLNDWAISSFRQWWRCALISAASVALLVLLAALAGGAKGPRSATRLGRLGATATATWLLLATAGLACTLAAQAAYRDYDRAVAAAAADPFAAIAGPAADRLLDGLRNWDARAD